MIRLVRTSGCHGSASVGLSAPASYRDSRSRIDKSRYSPRALYPVRKRGKSSRRALRAVRFFDTSNGTAISRSSSSIAPRDKNVTIARTCSRARTGASLVILSRSPVVKQEEIKFDTDARANRFFDSTARGHERRAEERDFCFPLTPLFVPCLRIPSFATRAERLSTASSRSLVVRERGERTDGAFESEQMKIAGGPESGHDLI